MLTHNIGLARASGSGHVTRKLVAIATYSYRSSSGQKICEHL